MTLFDNILIVSFTLIFYFQLFDYPVTPYRVNIMSTQSLFFIRVTILHTKHFKSDSHKHFYSILWPWLASKVHEWYMMQNASKATG